MKTSDRELGMHRGITRRDILHGVGAAAAASMVPGSLLAGAVGGKQKRYYPPSLTGLRGNHIGSFEVAHAVAREGRRDWGPVSELDPAIYDLVVVGGGTSGLAAAHYYQEQKPDARILILDNHDDFGGHAKRNEFTVKGRKLIGYGGCQSLEAPSGYPGVLKKLLVELGVDLDRFYKLYDQDFYRDNGLEGAVFFNGETWGQSKLVRYDLSKLWWTAPLAPSPLSAAEAVASMPISEAARQEMLHLLTLKEDQLKGMSYWEREEYLSAISYREFLERHLGATESDVLKTFSELTTDLGASYEAVTAIGTLVYVGLPGFEAAGLPDDDEDPYIHHFPDGNASITRLLVRKLIPGVAPGSTMDDVVLTDFDYSELDVAESPVRLRLNSTVVDVEHTDDPATAKSVAVTYVRNGSASRVTARHCVLGCDAAIVPSICSELPAGQREALTRGVRVPLTYTNVALRNWQAFKNLGIGGVSSPGSYYQTTMLDFPVSMGGYAFSRNPSDPVLVHMAHYPNYPDAGLDKRQQCQRGRIEMLTTSFDVIERNTRSQLAGILEDGGFDPAGDIAGITVNRWPHGYSHQDWLLDDWYEDPNDDRWWFVRGRKTYGRIAIANVDASPSAFIDGAVVQAHRAVDELLA